MQAEMADLKLENVDDSELDIEDLWEVLEAMEDVAVKYKRIGAALRIKNGELQIIEKQNRHDPKAGLSAVLENWLNLNYSAKRGEIQQPPSWRKVVEVVAKSVAGGNHALARKIASDHPYIRTIDPPVVNTTTTEELLGPTEEVSLPSNQTAFMPSAILLPQEQSHNLSSDMERDMAGLNISANPANQVASIGQPHECWEEEGQARTNTTEVKKALRLANNQDSPSIQSQPQATPSSTVYRSNVAEENNGTFSNVQQPPVNNSQPMEYPQQSMTHNEHPQQPPPTEAVIPTSPAALPGPDNELAGVHAPRRQDTVAAQPTDEGVCTQLLITPTGNVRRTVANKDELDLPSKPMPISIANNPSAHEKQATTSFGEANTANTISQGLSQTFVHQPPPAHSEPPVSSLSQPQQPRLLLYGGGQQQVMNNQQPQPSEIPPRPPPPQQAPYQPNTHYNPAYLYGQPNPQFSMQPQHPYNLQQSTMMPQQQFYMHPPTSLPFPQSYPAQWQSQVPFAQYPPWNQPYPAGYGYPIPQPHPLQYPQNMQAGPPNMQAGQPNMQAGPPNMQAGQPNMQVGPYNMQTGPPNMQFGPPNMQAGPPTTGNQFVPLSSQMQQSAPATAIQHKPGAMTETSGPQATAEEKVGTPREEMSRDKGEVHLEAALVHMSDGQVLTDRGKRVTQYDPFSREKKFSKIPLTCCAAEPQRTGLERYQVPDNEKYDMTNFPHGIAVIINNKTFKSEQCRYGTDIDCRDLVLTLRYLGYIVLEYKDLSAKEIHEVIEKVRTLDDLKYNKERIRDHSKFDSFMCCILSHGENGVVYGIDSTKVQITHLTYKLRADVCPSLAKKPKLFFIQSCRGPQVDGGNDVGDLLGLIAKKDQTEISAVTDASVSKVADFFVGYSTSADFVSFRDPTKGTWYIWELCDALCCFSTSRPLRDIMDVVHEKVNTEHSFCEHRQAPIYETSLRKKIFFWTL